MPPATNATEALLIKRGTWKRFLMVIHPNRIGTPVLPPSQPARWMGSPNPTEQRLGLPLEAMLRLELSILAERPQALPQAIRIWPFPVHSEHGEPPARELPPSPNLRLSNCEPSNGQTDAITNVSSVVLWKWISRWRSFTSNAIGADLGSDFAAVHAP
jgi:hypothetical protein